jgi:hypothetical protein
MAVWQYGNRAELKRKSYLLFPTPLFPYSLIPLILTA